MVAQKGVKFVETDSQPADHVWKSDKGNITTESTVSRRFCVFSKSTERVAFPLQLQLKFTRLSGRSEGRIYTWLVETTNDSKVETLIILSHNELLMTDILIVAG